MTKKQIKTCHRCGVYSGWYTLYIAMIVLAPKRLTLAAPKIQARQFHLAESVYHRGLRAEDKNIPARIKGNDFAISGTSADRCPMIDIRRRR